MISGAYDTEEWHKLPVSERPDVVRARTELAHILPFSLGSFSESQVSLDILNVARLLNVLKLNSVGIQRPCGMVYTGAFRQYELG